MGKNIFNVTSYLVIFVALQLGIGLTATMVAQKAFGVADSDAMTMVVASALANCAVIAVFLSFKMATLGKGFLLSRPMPVLAWSVLAALGTVIPSVWLQEMLPPLPDTVSEQMMKMVRTHGGYFAIAILAPLAEEIVFRGAILRLLCECFKSRWAAIAVSAFLFALIHANPAQMPHAFIVGLLLGWMYCRTKSIIPGVVYHWCNNTVAYLMAVAVPDPDAKLIELYGGNQTSLILSIVFSLCILLPSLYQLKRSFDSRK